MCRDCLICAIFTRCPAATACCSARSTSSCAKAIFQKRFQFFFKNDFCFSFFFPVQLLEHVHGIIPIVERRGVCVCVCLCVCVSEDAWSTLCFTQGGEGGHSVCLLKTCETNAESRIGGRVYNLLRLPLENDGDPTLLVGLSECAPVTSGTSPKYCAVRPNQPRKLQACSKFGAPAFSTG